MPYADPEKQRAYQREWMQRRRDAWFALNGPCVDCGTWDALELDHEDYRTKVTHRLWSWSEPRRLTELAKCVARCEPCHAAKTLAEGSVPHSEAVARKLTVAKVREIHARKAAGETLRALGLVYGVSNVTIHKICKGTEWRHVDG